MRTITMMESRQDRRRSASPTPVRPTPLLALACACIGWIGCVPDERADPPVVTRDSAGISITEHAALSHYNAPAFQAAYLMETDDGGIFGTGEFGFVADADLVAGGRVAVLDRMTAEVRLFSIDGGFLRSVGRRGSGPGELSGGATLGILPLSEGRFALPDVINRAFVVFDTSGEHRANLPLDVTEAGTRWRIWSADTVVTVRDGNEAEALVVRPLQGAGRDTVARVPSSGRERSPGGRAPLMTDHLLWSVASPGRFVTARMSRPEITVYEGGVARRVIRWAHPSREVTHEDGEALLAIAARVIGDRGGDPDVARDLMALPSRLPAMADVEAGEGIVMVQRLRSPQEMDRRILSTLGPTGYGGAIWDLFAWTGEYLGMLDFGMNVEVFGIRGDTIVGIKEDSLGVATVFLARMPDALEPSVALTPP